MRPLGLVGCWRKRLDGEGGMVGMISPLAAKEERGEGMFFDLF